MAKLRRAALVVALPLVVVACAGDDGWSEGYRAEQMGQCSNATSAVVGYAVVSWCECLLDWREDHRSESEDRGRNGIGVDHTLRNACRFAEPPELTQTIDQASFSLG